MERGRVWSPGPIIKKGKNMLHEHPKCNTCRHCKKHEKLVFIDGGEEYIPHYMCEYHEGYFIADPRGQYCSEHETYKESKGGKHEQA